MSLKRKNDDIDNRVGLIVLVVGIFLAAYTIMFWMQLTSGDTL